MMKRALLTLASLVCFGIGSSIFIAVGLPQRADYTAFELPGETRTVAPEIGRLAPPFEANTLTGERLSLWALRGQTVILNFWATWCTPCRVEMPDLQQIHGGDVRVIAVNLGESPAQIQPWVDDLNLTFDIVLDVDSQIATRYWFRAPPSTYVIDPQGVIRAIFYGPVTINQLQDAISY
ncbi:MAG: hypothetical protein CUN56_08050 [Phototrophicales bacterium]|nr:MAG: hypothetical protein CUN56_08050 [Phototrophicales bacterium]RMG71201.1 MAG: TlpA family protein disulfide reductase [Chloroflexota bacterium]